MQEAKDVQVGDIYYHRRKENTDLPFDGDSIDREIVREILINSRNPT